PSHSQGVASSPARSRTWTCGFGNRHDLRFTTRAAVPGAGVEPTSAVSETAILPLDDPGMKVAEEGVEPSRPKAAASEAAAYYQFGHAAKGKPRPLIRRPGRRSDVSWLSVSWAGFEPASPV